MTKTTTEECPWSQGVRSDSKPLLDNSLKDISRKNLTGFMRMIIIVSGGVGELRSPTPRNRVDLFFN